MSVWCPLFFRHLFLHVADLKFERPFARAPQFWIGGGLRVVVERFRVSPSVLSVLLEPFGLLTLLSYLTFIMSQLSEHDYSILECLLNHTWANEKWGEQLPRRIPLDTLGSMLSASQLRPNRFNSMSSAE